MVIEYKGGSVSSSRENFLERKKYKETAFFEGAKMLDTWYEKPNYGLYTTAFEPVVLNTDDSGSNLVIFGDYAPASISAPPFVVQTFNAFRSEYLEKQSTSALSFPKFLDGLTPVSAFINFEAVYQRYIALLVSEVSSIMSRKINDSFSFEAVFDEIVQTNLSKFPITRSGFLLSNKCPMNVSGLCIELASLEYNDDAKKGELLQSKDFVCFVESANDHGFYVDKNAPWRLVADLDSDAMIENLSQYRENTDVENILNKTFRTKTHYEDISSFYYFYSSVRSRIAAKMKQRGHPEPPRISERRAISKTLEIRMLEVGSSMSDYEKNNRIILDMHDVYSVRYSRNTLKLASAKIGSICSDQIRNTYSKRMSIDSYKPTTIKDYR